jgi:hypothetical protein
MMPSPIGEYLRDSKLDVIVAVSNVYHLSGVPTLTQRLIPTLLAVEPLTYSADGIFHVEDMAEITDEGVRLLSDASRWAALTEAG